MVFPVVNLTPVGYLICEAVAETEDAKWLLCIISTDWLLFHSLWLSNLIFPTLVLWNSTFNWKVLEVTTKLFDVRKALRELVFLWFVAAITSPILQLCTWLTYFFLNVKDAFNCCSCLEKSYRYYLNMLPGKFILASSEYLLASKLQVPFSNPLFNVVSQVFSSLLSDCNYRVFIYRLTGNSLVISRLVA